MNKIIEKENYGEYIVISTIRDGVEKYISRDFNRKNAFHYTVKLNKAMMFRNYEMANRFISYNYDRIDNPNKIKVYIVKYSKEVNEIKICDKENE